MNVGDVVYGYAGGYFGRDSYEDKTCIATGFYAEEPYAVFCSVSPIRRPDFYVISGRELEAIEEYTVDPDRKLTLEELRDRINM